MTTNPALKDHQNRLQRFESEAAKWEKLSKYVSLARLLLFVFGALFLSQGYFGQMNWAVYLGILIFVGFVVAVLVHWRILSRLDAAQIRQRIHQRHIQRITGRWKQLNSGAEGLLDWQHPYAADIDLIGEGSLFQRIDVSHTRTGERALVDWLSRVGDLDVINQRQSAVGELGERVTFRQELEAAALTVTETERLDERSFLKLSEIRRVFQPKSPLVLLIFLFPTATLILFGLTIMGFLAEYAFLSLLPVHLLLLLRYRQEVRKVLDLLTARYAAVEAFEKMLLLVEQTEFKSSYLRVLKRRICIGNIAPSVQLRRLRFWVGLAEVRQQFLVHVFINPILLWDLHVLRGVQKWVDAVGRQSYHWFEALGEFEALSSLATLAYGDPNTAFPKVIDGSSSLEAKDLTHPLLPVETRVANDVIVKPRNVWMITGSNMAGKSTLLRTVGVNIALALAGGPVCAKSMRLPLVRLRTSMRIDDSLQQGASYFYAELQKLRRVIQNTEGDPPVFFLIDELLRGTNDRARQVGGIALLTHLLNRNTMGLIATHHFAFTQVCDRFPDRVTNMHFTDTVIDGKMRFDYRLRPGVVQGSNAIRLLREIGVDVNDDDSFSDPNLSV